MNVDSIFLLIVSPPLIAISIICSCNRQLKILPIIDTKNTDLKSMNSITSKNDKILSAITSTNSITSNSNSEKHISNNKSIFKTNGNKTSIKNGIVNIIPKKSNTQLSEMNQKSPNKQSWKNTKQNKLKQQNMQMKDIPKLLSQQIVPSNESNYKCLDKKENNLQRAKSEEINFSNFEEQMKQSIICDSNQNETEISALMADGIVIFPRQLKWKLINTAQQVKLQNPTENRFAIKVKCTDNNLYRVKPVFTFIEPKSSVIFNVNRYDSNATIDHILFLTTSAEKTDDNPRLLFADSMANSDETIEMMKTAPLINS
ncbi:MSP (Major sperm protein) domain family protein [Brugia pahangi]